MADSTIDGLPTIGSIDRTTDKLAIWDASDSLTGEMTINSALGFSGGNPVSTSDSQTLTNKTLTSPTINTPTLTVNDDSLTLQDNSDTTKKAVFQLSGITTGTTRTLTLPDANITLVGTAATQTLTNKTLTAPTITNPTLTVDTISEFTSANGVTIDGMLIKDGTVGPGTITPAGLVSGTGSTWPWSSWTPTWTNLTVGNGTVNARYKQTGKTVDYELILTFGSTTSIGGNVSVTVPVTSATYGSFHAVGMGSANDGGAVVYILGHCLSSTTVGAVFSTTTNTAAFTFVTSTSPFTWTTGDILMLSGTYEAA